MKKPIFKSKSIPGLSKKELNKMTNANLASREVGKANVESGHLDSIRPMALDAYMNGDYWHSEDHRASLSKGGVASSVVNLERGNIGEDSAMSRWKKAVKAIERSKLLLNINGEFMAKSAMEYFTSKQWGYVRQTNLVINTGKKGGYHNAQPIYKLNYEAIELALKQSVNPDDYFKKNETN